MAHSYLVREVKDIGLSDICGEKMCLSARAGDTFIIF